MICLAVLISLVAWLIVAGCRPAPAPTPAFPAKAIYWIIPTPPGGGTDLYSGLVTKYLPKYLPCKVEVVPVNMPGVA